MRKPITCPMTGHIETVDLECTSLEQDDLLERVLVLYAVASRGRQPAEAIANALREESMTVEVADVETGAAPPPEDYDGLVIVAPRGVWGYARKLSAYLDEHDATLRAMPSWYFPISRSGDTTARQLTGRAHELARMISDDMPALDRAP